MSRRHHNGTKTKIQFLETALHHNVQAITEGPRRKVWSKHDLRTIKPLTPAQEDMFDAWNNDKHIAAHGSSGSGKTFIAIYLALTEVLDKKQKQLIIVRSIVPTREVGYLPGGLNEKIAQYELPYHDIFWELIGRQSTYQNMKDAGLVDFMTTSFVRGLTWDNAVVIDEGQNMTFHEINSIMTRLGEGSRVIFTGDLAQSDLDGKKNGTCGMSQFLKVIHDINNFESVRFTVNDIVRSSFVKSWIVAAEQYLAA